MLDALFDPHTLIQTAQESADTDDLWGDWFREGLEILAPAIAAEAGLYPARAWRIARWLLEILDVRARVARTLRERDPTTERSPVERPIFVTGMPRTGTTMLHNLLAGLPGLRGFTPWQMRYVVPEFDAGAGWRDGARADTAAEIRALYERVPELARIHPMAVDAPDECHWLTRHSLTALFFTYVLYVPSYTRWLLSSPRPQVYAEHRVQLQLLIERDRAGSATSSAASSAASSATSSPGAGRLVLKDPGHLWHLGELFDAYPDARVVRLHRDPRESLPSLCSLLHTFHRMDSSRVDARKLGPYVLDIVDRGLAGEREARTNRSAATILDIEYRDLVSDPIGTVRRICAWAEHPIDERDSARITAWLAENPKDKSGRHVYRAGDFGLTPEQIVERLGERG